MRGVGMSHFTDAEIYAEALEEVIDKIRAGRIVTRPDRLAASIAKADRQRLTNKLGERQRSKPPLVTRRFDPNCLDCAGHGTAIADDLVTPYVCPCGQEVAS